MAVRRVRATRAVLPLLLILSLCGVWAGAELPGPAAARPGPTAVVLAAPAGAAVAAAAPRSAARLSTARAHVFPGAAVAIAAAALWFAATFGWARRARRRSVAGVAAPGALRCRAPPSSGTALS